MELKYYETLHATRVSDLDELFIDNTIIKEKNEKK